MGDDGAGIHRVVLCDDAHEFVRLAQLLLEAEPDFEVVGLAHDGERAIEVCRALQPDVLLLDISMPLLDGLSALPRVLEVSADTRIVMLTAFDTQHMQRDALAMGAVGYIIKGEQPLDLASTVRALL